MDISTLLNAWHRGAKAGINGIVAIDAFSRQWRDGIDYVCANAQVGFRMRITVDDSCETLRNAKALTQTSYNAVVNGSNYCPAAYQNYYTWPLSYLRIPLWI
ncbi:hypothetical protein CBL_09101 [Carabus blaptoides fortunei]